MIGLKQMIISYLATCQVREFLRQMMTRAADPMTKHALSAAPLASTRLGLLSGSLWPVSAFSPCFFVSMVGNLEQIQLRVRLPHSYGIAAGFTVMIQASPEDCTGVHAVHLQHIFQRSSYHTIFSIKLCFYFYLEVGVLASCHPCKIR